MDYRYYENLAVRVWDGVKLKVFMVYTACGDPDDRVLPLRAILLDWKKIRSYEDYNNNEVNDYRSRNGHNYHLDDNNRADNHDNDGSVVHNLHCKYGI